MENDLFLEDVQEELKQIVQPFQRELNKKQKKADFIKQCIRGAEKEDFLRLDELLKSKIANEIEADEEFEECSAVFAGLRGYADEEVEQYRIQLIEDLIRLCEEAELEIEVDFPDFTVLKGINGKIDFSSRCTKINQTVLKSIDPRRITTTVQKLKRQLYDHPYDAQTFIDSLYQIYTDILAKGKLAPGDSVFMQQLYLEYVISLQSKPFFQNMDKAKFRGYSLDQFSVDMWRYYQSDIEKTSDGYEFQLSGGRSKALWIMDNQGELRQFSTISFTRQEN
ncbi:MAG: hypothetical protein U9N77_06395 [Thermodesulfobacteriota bacterium]|nr:hypothetical protein [Thermodesulfobacteriota bacterium]